MGGELIVFVGCPVGLEAPAPGLVDLELALGFDVAAEAVLGDLTAAILTIGDGAAARDAQLAIGKELAVFASQVDALLTGHQRRDGQILGIVDRPEIRLPVGVAEEVARPRSEQHTSELQSLMRTSYAVFCL